LQLLFLVLYMAQKKKNINMSDQEKEILHTYIEMGKLFTDEQAAIIVKFVDLWINEKLAELKKELLIDRKP
jgi:hypothetical protein